MVQNKARCVLIFINCIFKVVGFWVLGLGLWLKFGPNTHHIYDLGDRYKQYGTFVEGVRRVLALGSVMLVMSVFGNYGAGRMKSCPLKVFSVLVAILIVALVVIGVEVELYGPEIVEFYVLLSDIYKYSGDPAVSVSLTALSSVLHCCGPTGRDQDTQKNPCSDDLDIPGCPMSARNLSTFIVTEVILFIALICSTILLKGISAQQQNNQQQNNQQNNQLQSEERVTIRTVRVRYFTGATSC